MRKPIGKTVTIIGLVVLLILMVFLDSIIGNIQVLLLNIWLQVIPLNS